MSPRARPSERPARPTRCRRPGGRARPAVNPVPEHRPDPDLDRDASTDPTSTVTASRTSCTCPRRPPRHTRDNPGHRSGAAGRGRHSTSGVDSPRQVADLHETWKIHTGGGRMGRTGHPGTGTLVQPRSAPSVRAVRSCQVRADARRLRSGPGTMSPGTTDRLTSSVRCRWTLLQPPGMPPRGGEEVAVRPSAR